MAFSSSAKRRRCRGISFGAASMPSGSPPAAAPAWRSPSGVAKGEPPYVLWRRRHPPFGRKPFDVDWVERARWRLLRQALHHGLAVRGARPGRPLRRSPLYDRLKAQGAVSAKARWERPQLVRDRPPATSRATSTPTAQNWFEAVGREHRAAASGSSSSTSPPSQSSWMVGRDAEAALSWSCANDVSKPHGRAHLYADAECARRPRSAT
jgi:4-methylaminobutanoate oxidase (formaldehyde-forming)